MHPIAIYTLTSSLHDEASVAGITDRFLGEIFPEGGYDFRGEDFTLFGDHPVDLIFVRTGGTEGIFRDLLPGLLDAGIRRFNLLTSGKSNSLAASMEILSYLRGQGLEGEIIHGKPESVRKRIGKIMQVEETLERLRSTCLGVIGHPSDWLIASGTDYQKIYEKLGIWLEDIPMEELLEAIKESRCHEEIPEAAGGNLSVREAFPGAVRIHEALKTLIVKHNLQGLTLRCFDLLGAVGNTGCLALARLNADGIPAGCEGDIPALLSMTIARAATGSSGFQANPSRIDTETGEMVLAHCTIPLDLVSDYTFDTHFESGIGVGIRGHFPEGPVTLFKVSGDLNRFFIAEGELIRNLSEPDLCRTQIAVRLDPADAEYFLHNPIGNHHIVLPGHHKQLLTAILNRI